MKKIFAIAVAGIFFSSVAVAQKNEDDKQEKKSTKKEMKQEVGISDEQGQQLKGINQKYKGQMGAIKNDQSLSKEQRKERMRSMNEQRRREMGNVLSPEQREKMKAYREKHPRKHHRHHHGKKRDGQKRIS